MIALVNGKGEQVNDFQFQSWNEAENYLSEQRRKGKSGLYLRGDFGTPNFYCGFCFIAVDFGNCIDMGFNDLTSMVIKAKHIPCPDELMVWLRPAMDQDGYTDFIAYYATEANDVFEDYDTENIDNWPIFGA